MSVTGKSETTLVVIKPDGYKRGLVGDVISMIELKGLYLVDADVRNVDTTFAMEHYKDHQGKEYFDGLCNFLSSGVAFAVVVSGPNAISRVREIVGNYKDPERGTIRGKYATSQMENVVHASSSAQDAEREIELWFPKPKMITFRG